MVVYNNVLAGAAGQGGDDGYKIEQSLRFNSDDSAYLNNTPRSAGNQKTFTLSCWAKISKLDAEKNILVGQSNWFRFENTNKIYYWHNASTNVHTDAVFRDPSAWYHVVLAVDTTQATASNRVKIYVNGVQQTLSGTQPTQNADLGFNGNYVHYLGSQGTSGSNAFNGYLAEIFKVDGQQLTADDFGEEDDNGVWQAKDCKDNLTYGTSGFYLNFSDNSSNSALGLDQKPGATQNPSVTGYGTSGGGSPSQAVDGIASSSSEYSVRTNSAGVTLGTSVTASSKVRIYGTAESGNYEINNTSTNIAPSSWPNRGWTDVSSALTFPISISSFGITGGSANDGGRLAAIEIDDVILTGTANDFTVNNLIANVEGVETSAISSISGNTLTFTDSTNLEKFSAGDIIQEVSDAPRSGYTSQVPTNPENAVDGDINTHTIFGSNSGSSSDWYEWTLPYARSYTTLQIVMSGSAASGNDVYIGASNGTQSQATNQFEGSLTSTATAYTLTNMPNPVKSFSLFLAGGNYSPTFKLHGLIIDGSYVKTVTATSVSVANNQIVSEAGGDWATGRTAVKPAVKGDDMLDTPTNYTAVSGNNGGNYATLNFLNKGSAITLSNGNLDHTASSGTAWEDRFSFSTIGVTSGKWYAESTITSTNNDTYVGVVGDPQPPFTTSLGYQAHGWGYYSQGSIFWQGGTSQSAASFTAGDTIGVALDLDNLTIKFYKNGSLAGTRTGLTAGKTYFFGANSYSNCEQSWNFGQYPFAISSVPTGHKALCTQNLPDPSITNPLTAFDVDLYTGTNASLERSNFAFSPDFLWFKSRSGSRTHALFDSVRGRAKALESQTNGTEYTSDANRDLVSFDNDGFTVGQTQNFSSVNRSGDSIVVWGWDAGTSTASNTDGSITANVRANTSAGFSIIQFLGNATSGATVGHGLLAAPELVIGKNRGGGDAWWVWFKAHSSNASKFLKLNTEGAETSTSAIANNTAPSSTVITLGQDYGWNSSQSPGSILYAFTPVSQFSAFGTYTGNNSTDGPFVYTGFRPAWVMVKGTGSSNTFSWVIVDSERSTYNPTDHALFPNSSNIENSLPNYGDRDFYIDLLSNGFKLRIDPQSINTNGQEYVWAAFARHPFKTARAR